MNKKVRSATIEIVNEFTVVTDVRLLAHRAWKKSFQGEYSSIISEDEIEGCKASIDDGKALSWEYDHVILNGDNFGYVLLSHTYKEEGKVCRMDHIMLTYRRYEDYLRCTALPRVASLDVSWSIGKSLTPLKLAIISDLLGY